MAIELVRKPSLTPNVVNYDDYRMLRYATGGYNGVNSKYANKCAYEIEGSNFKIKSGEIFLHGVQSKIDGIGETITVVNIAGTQYYSVYLEVDLSIVDNQKTTIKSLYNAVAYPTIEVGDDLTELQTGVARLELYRFTASSGVISNVAQRFSLIEVGNVLHAENADLATNATNADNSIKNNDNTYSSLTQNLNNQLRVGNVDNVEVIEKRTLLWKGNPTNSVDLSGFNLQENDEIDIRCLLTSDYAGSSVVEYFRLVLSSTERWYNFTFSTVLQALPQPRLGVYAKDICYSLSSVYCEEERYMNFEAASQTPGAAVTLQAIHQLDNPAVITEVWKVIK